MNEWEAKYKALLMGIDNQEYIDNAERLVEAAQRQAACGICTFREAVNAMMDFVAPQQMTGTLARIKMAERAFAEAME